MNRSALQQTMIRLLLAGVAAGAVFLASGCVTSQERVTNILEPRELVPPPYLAPPVEAPKVEVADVTPPKIKAPEVKKAAPTPKPTPVSRRREQATPKRNLPPRTFNTELPPVTAEVKPPKPAAPSRPKPAIKVMDVPSGTTPAPKVAAAKPLTYKVKRGDSLWAIAKRHRVGVAELAAFNKRDAKAILPIGLVLTIPPGGKLVPGDATPASKRAAPTAKVAKRAAPARQPLPANGIHTVRKGDSLWTIGQSYGLSVRELKTLNNMNSDLIRPGDGLRLTNSAVAKAAPAPSGARAITAVAVSRSGSANSRRKSAALPADGKHTVRPGESLWVIARKYGTTVADIQSRNKLPSTRIYPGEVLVIGKASQASFAPTLKAPVAPPATGAAAAPPKSKVGLTREQVLAMDKLPHYVEETDTLGSIAEMYSSKVEWLLIVNPQLKANQELKDVAEIKVPVANAFD